MLDTCRVLLTGSTGFIGRAVASSLQKYGIVPVAPTHREINLTDASATTAILGTGRFNVVLHFASGGVRGNANDLALIEHELSMAKTLLPLLCEGGIFLYAGSVSEYGHAGRLTEDAVCTPQNAYARAKLETGQWLRTVGPERGIAVRVARIFGAYGNGEAQHRLFPAVITALEGGHPVDLSDGQQVRDFVHVEDVAAACIALSLVDTAPDCINVGTGKGLKVRYVVEKLCREMRADPELLRFGGRARSPHDLNELVADTTLLERCIGQLPPQRLSATTMILPLLR